MSFTKMIHLKVDGKDVAVEKGTSILAAAARAGIFIPTLCHDERLIPFGSCRICIVEERGKKGSFVPACFTPVREGMDIITDSSEIRRSRRKNLELLLLNHPMDCPICDKRGDCTLQALVYEYGLSDRVYPWQKITFPLDTVSPFIARDPNKCILCGKCVRICNEIQGRGALGFIGRGVTTRIGTSYDQVLDCEFCGQCIGLCPVGALTSTLFDYETRWWELRETSTICSFCSCGCTIIVGTKEGIIKRVESDPAIGSNQGLLCVKGRFGWEYVHSPARLSIPLMKKSGVLTDVSWEEALHYTAEKLREIKTYAGGDSIAGIASERLTNEECYLFQKFMRAVLSTNHIDHAGSFLSSGLLGLKECLGYAATTNSLSEIKNAEIIMLVRCNPFETHPLIKCAINQALRDTNPQLIIIHSLNLKVRNPVGTSPLQKTPSYLVHWPGSEVALLNGMLRVLVDEECTDETFIRARAEGFEEVKHFLKTYTLSSVEVITGVKRDLIREAAITFARAKSVAIIVGSGNCFMGDERELTIALCNLFLATGKLGKRGSGIYFLGEKSNTQGAFDMGVSPYVLPGQQEIADETVRGRFEKRWNIALPPPRGLSALEMIQQAEVKRIRALYLVGVNPLATYPGYFQTRKALEALDFLLVQDLFLTETAQHATVVLPASSWAEKEGTYTNLERRVQKLNAAFPSYGQSKADSAIILELSNLLGYHLDYPTPEEVMKEISELVPLYGGIRHERMEGGSGIQWPCPDSTHPGTPMLCCNGAMERKARFIPVAHRMEKEENAEYPFMLITGSLLFHSGSLSLESLSLKKICPDNYIEINPEDAKGVSVNDGDQVLVTSKNGKLTVRCRVSARSPRGVAFMPSHFSPGLNVLTDKGGGITRIRISTIPY